MTFLYPTSDIITSNWSASTGINIYALLDEENTPNDTDYTSALVNNSPSIVLGFTTVSAGNHSINIRSRVTAGTYQIVVSFLNSSNTTQGSSDITNINDTLTTYNIPVTTTGNSDRVKIEIINSEFSSRSVVTDFLDVVSGNFDGG